MGDDLLVTYTGSKTRQRRKVLNFIQHPEFSRDTFQNDIAMIRVCNILATHTFKLDNFQQLKIVYCFH